MLHMRSSIILAVALFAGCAETEYRGAHVGGKSVQKALCPTGCSDEVERMLATGGRFEQVQDGVFVSVGQIAADDVCNLLPEDGICADACDPDALKKYASPGSCIDFKCVLRDGREIVAGACALP